MQTMETPKSNKNQPPPPPSNDDGGALAATTTGGERLWKLLVSIADSLLVPCTPLNAFLPSLSWASIFSNTSTSSVSSSSTAVVIGTILSDQETAKNKVKLCFQLPRDPNPFVILDLPISHLDSDGACRVVLECDRAKAGGGPLMNVVTWTVYFNGRRVGFGSRREVDAGAGWALDSLRGVSTGVGVLPPPPTADDGPRTLEYMRGKFERVVGSADSESYHLVDPAGCLGGNELSFFFVRL